MTIFRRFLDLAVWSVIAIHLVFELHHVKFRSLSFVALDRSSGGGMFQRSVFVGCSQVSVSRRS